MKIEVSIGEVVDKLSILDIKKTKILNEEKLGAVNKELDLLAEARDSVKEFPYSFWYILLVDINMRIWNLTDTIKSITPSENYEQFALLSNMIFNLNQERFRLKDRFNKAFTSDIQEQKSYTTTTLEIYVDNLDIFYSKLSEINEKSLKYDRIVFISSYKNEIETIYNTYPFSVVCSDPSPSSVNIRDLIHEEETSKYMFPPIKYVAGGRLGDFILSLSVVNEMFLKTGRKADLFLDVRGDTFAFQLEQVYNDTYIVISTQKYIHSYSIYSDNNPYDIDLTIWRNSNLLFKSDWNIIYSDIYGIDWGRHKWIHIEENMNLKEVMKKHILIHSSTVRINTKYDFKRLMAENPNYTYLFISNNDNEYYEFIKRTSCSEIKFLKAESFLILCTYIDSCAFFIGNLSMPNALADALFKKRHTLLSGWSDDTHISGMVKMWDTVTYYES